MKFALKFALNILIEETILSGKEKFGRILASLLKWVYDDAAATKIFENQVTFFLNMETCNVTQ